MKVLILGAGQDAYILSYIFFKKYKLKTYICARDMSIDKSIMNWANIYPCGSFTEKNNIENLFKLILKIKPEFVVNTAALSSSIECNQFPELVYEINGYFPIKLIKFLSENKINLIHFGSILEKENRPSCTYTNSKLIVSNFLKDFKSESIIKNLLLPNHESPLRDERFFVRELITIFKPIINSSNKNSFQIEILDGLTLRYWSWAPTLMGSIAKMICSKNFDNNFDLYTTKLNLIQLSALVARVFDIDKLSIKCKNSGEYSLENIKLPKINKSTEAWIKKLFITEYSDRYNLDSWCEDFKN